MNEPVHTVSDYSPGMARASMFLGVFSLIMIATGFSFIIGSVGIILAVLSRGRGPLPGQAKTGLITSAFGIIGGIIVTVTAFLSLFSGNLSETLSRLDSLYETYVNQGTLNPSDIDRALSRPGKDSGSPEKTALTVVLPDGEEVAV